MLKLIIEDDEGRKSVVPFARDEISIGRLEGNSIRLSERNVSRRHARLRRVDGHVVVEDLGSSYGVLLNGKRLRGEAPFREGDLLQIGDYDLVVQGRAETVAPPSPAAPLPPESRAASDRDQTPPPETAPTRHELPALGSGPSEDARGTEQLETAEEDAGDVSSVAAAEAPRLLVLNTDLAGREFACIRTRLSLGRADDNDIGIDHPSLSRTHARLVRIAGDWVLIDQSSVNGSRLHGERIDRARLEDGDEFDLGHVRLRFVGPRRPGFATRRLLVRVAMGTMLAAGLAVLVLAGLLAWSPQLAATILPASVRQRLGPGGPSALAVAPGEEDPQGTAVNGAPLERVPEGSSGMELKRFEAAVAAANARNFQSAVELLEGFPEESRPPQAAQMLARARDELAVRGRLSEAQRLLDAGDVPEAEALLRASGDTRAWARELSVMQGRLATATAAWVERRSAEDAAARSAREEVQQQIEALYRKGRSALVAGRVREAESAFLQCVSLEVRASPCHLGLGGTYARTAGKAALGATHYEAFLELSPADPAAPAVKKLLADYHRARRAAGE